MAFPIVQADSTESEVNEKTASDGSINFIDISSLSFKDIRGRGRPTSIVIEVVKPMPIPAAVTAAHCWSVEWFADRCNHFQKILAFDF